MRTIQPAGPGATEFVASGMWLALFSLGSPVLPDARYIKLALVLVSCAYLLRRAKFTRPTGTTIILSALIVGIQLWVCTCAYSNNALISQRVVLLATLTIAVFALSTQGSALVLTSFTYGALIALVFGWVMTLANQVPGQLKTSFGWLGLKFRYSGLFIAPNTAGLVALLCTITLLHSQIHKAFLIFPILTLLGSEYRGGIMALMVCALWVLIKHLKGGSPRTMLIAYSRLTIGILLAIPIYLRIVTARGGSSDATTGRRLIWHECMNYVHSQGIFGGGPDTIERNIGLSMTANNAATGSFQFFHCHNQLLNVAVDFGYVGAILTTLPTFGLVILGIRRTHRAFELIGVGIAAAGLLESPLHYLGTQGEIWPIALAWSALLAMTYSNGFDSESEQQGIQKIKNSS